MTDDGLKNILVRVRSLTLDTAHGATIVNDILRRDITFKINQNGDITNITKPGIALIATNLEPVARALSRITLTIQRLPEFLFMPVNAHRDPMVGLWTVEAVPFVDWLRLIIKTDEAYLQELGVK